MRVHVVDRQKLIRVSKPGLRRLARAAFVGRQPVFDEVSLVLVDDETIRRLNATFRRKDRVTDVLSFDLRATRGPAAVRGGLPHAELPPVGEVVVSAPRAVRQARSHGVRLEHELARLFLHGLLHLQGFDHQRAAERRLMRAEETRLLETTRDTIAALVLAGS